MTGRSILRRTCALPVMVRAMPENEIPPAMRVDYYFIEYADKKYNILIELFNKVKNMIKKVKVVIYTNSHMFYN